MYFADKNFNLEKIEIIKKISHIELQKIYKARDKNNNKPKYLIFSTVNTFECLTFDMHIDLYQKVNVMAKLNHPSILKFIGFSTTNLKKAQKPIILTEYSKYTMNVDFSKNPLIVIYGVASAMSYLHSRGILHRDLGIENIYLDKLHHPKLTGFDYSVDISENLEKSHPPKFSVFKGNAKNQAPEVLTKLEYSKSSDVYSFSMILYQLITGEAPFKNINNISYFIEKVALKGVRPSFNKPVPECYKNMIKAC